MSYTINYLDYTFADDDIISLTGATHEALLCEALSADECSFTVKVASTATLADFENFTYATPITIEEDSSTLYQFFVTNIAVTNKLQDGSYLARFTGLSFIGLTCHMQHDGGIYSHSSVSAVIAEILGGIYDSGESTNEVYWYNMPNDLHYTMDKLVANTRVDGWLPSTANSDRTARDNIRDVLFSSGVSILKNDDGSLHFTFNQPDSPQALIDDFIYEGEEFTESERVTAVTVIEHGFYQSGLPSVVLYDTGSDIVDHLKVVFEEAHYSLIGTGLTINASGANYAIISGQGTLEGRPYAHTQQEYTEATGLSGPSNVKVADCGLVNILNYLNVLKRVKNYYSVARTIKLSYKMTDNIKAGSLITFKDPLDRTKTGIIKNLNFEVSSFVKADAEIITDWLAVEVGNNYEYCDILTGSGTWSKSAAESETGKTISNAKVILIGGGNGGGNGANGTAGTSSAPGQGGAGGLGGDPGKVLSVDFEGSAPDSISYACGSGGAAGSNGTHTTISAGGSSYDSDNGIRPAHGYMNTITGDLYCEPGEDGYSGGNGGASGSEGGSVGSNSGGGYGQSKSQSYQQPYQTSTTIAGRTTYNLNYRNGGTANATGGGGGGAAYGANGSTGLAGTVTTTSQGGHIIRATPAAGGKGGNGANASARTETVALGSGGHGGHGGGGGGQGGNASGAGGYTVSGNMTSGYTITSISGTNSKGSGGSRGTGGAGTAGGNGVVFIYY